MDERAGGGTGSGIYTSEDLTSRLLDADRRRSRRLAFCIGSAVSSPAVPGVAAAIELMRETVADSPPDLAAFDAAVQDRRDGMAYQAGAGLLLARRGQDFLNAVVRRMTLVAHRESRDLLLTGELTNVDLTEEYCFEAEQDIDGWDIPDAAAATARLLVHRAAFIAGPVLTTNFDPLLEISIRREGGYVIIESLDADGRIGGLETPSGVRIVHLHGYWRHSDTLHVPVQLRQERRVLQRSLEDLLRERTLLVIGYGGWDDVFTGALSQAVAQQRHGGLDVLWSFYESQASEIQTRYTGLLNQIGAFPGRISLYSGVDCGALLPAIVASYGALPAPQPTAAEAVPEPLAPVELMDEPTAAVALAAEFERSTKLWVIGSAGVEVLTLLTQAPKLPPETIFAVARDSEEPNERELSALAKRGAQVFRLRRRLYGEPYRVELTDVAAYVVVRHPVSREAATLRYAAGTLQFDMMTRYANQILADSEVEAAA